MQVAIDTLRQTASNTVHSIPHSMPIPGSAPTISETIDLVQPHEVNPMAQSWQVISGFPETSTNPGHHFGSVV